VKRIPQLDGLRAIAVLLVFLHHAFLVPLTWSGVDLFFVLSGYLITTILLRQKEEHNAAAYWTTFYSRRLRRIAPPYIGLLIVLSILFPIPWNHLWYWYAFFGANIVTALGKCSVHAMVPLWSLAVEEQFYFAWPCLVLWCSPKTLKRLAVGIMVAAPVLRGLFTFFLRSRAPMIYYLTPFRADLLACGALIAICAAEDGKWIERSRQWALYAALGAGLLLTGFSAFRSFRLTADTIFFNTLGYSLVVVAFGAGLVRTLSMSRGLAFKILASRPMRYMGQISYTFYLYQVAVLDKLSPHVNSRAELAVVGFMITLLVSILSWHYLEQPILKLRLDPPSRSLETGAV
jgi:peptidoglycan/LPS O-acetylase OafA/YrhL